MFFPRLWPHSINYLTSNWLSLTAQNSNKNKCTPTAYWVGLARVNELIDGVICRIRILCLTTSTVFQEDAVNIIRFNAGNNWDFSTVIIALCDGFPKRNYFCKSFDTCLRETVVIPSIICFTVVYMLICIVCKK